MTGLYFPTDTDPGVIRYPILSGRCTRMGRTLPVRHFVAEQKEIWGAHCVTETATEVIVVPCAVAPVSDFVRDIHQNPMWSE